MHYLGQIVYRRIVKVDRLVLNEGAVAIASCGLDDIIFKVRLGVCVVRGAIAVSVFGAEVQAIEFQDEGIRCGGISIIRIYDGVI
jgi:hypothetical protein